MTKILPKVRVNKVNIAWSPNFAYAIGLIVSDGCLSGDGRHISFVSKDMEQIENYLKALNISCHIGKVFSGLGLVAYRVQFSDVHFYNFLNSLGITKAKSLTIGALQIPIHYFPSYLRGMFDGDGCTYSYWDKRWKSSFMFYLSFCSGSLVYIKWLQTMIFRLTKTKGHISFSSKNKAKNPCYQLRYAKRESLQILQKIYTNADGLFLSRKYLKINEALRIMGKHV